MSHEDKSIALPSHEDLARLACEDPSALEALRQELIDSLLDGAPERVKQRVLGLQFRIDGIRLLSHSALGATMKIHQLMWESFARMNEELQKLADLTRESVPTGRLAGGSDASEPSARIIPFRPRLTCEKSGRTPHR